MSWALLSGNRYVVQPTVVVDFRYTLPLPREFWKIYARGTYQNKPRFGNQQYRAGPAVSQYRLTRGLFDTRKLADGTYTLRVTVEDTAGNKTTNAEAITVCNADPSSCTQPRRASAPSSAAAPAVRAAPVSTISTICSTAKRSSSSVVK